MESLLKAEKKEICIQKVVASASFNHPVDLDAILKAFPHVEYRPEVFPRLPFRLKKPTDRRALGLIQFPATCEHLGVILNLT